LGIKSVCLPSSSSFNFVEAFDASVVVHSISMHLLPSADLGEVVTDDLSTPLEVQEIDGTVCASPSDVLEVRWQGGLPLVPAIDERDLRLGQTIGN
jgi:hypothetical protein